ncbi:MAG: MFS transporter [Rhizobiales bacterium]|nr:MFS transporter [Hyphomicrobiales bacterium]
MGNATMPDIMDQPAPPSAHNLRVIISAAAIVTLVGVSLSVSGPLLSLEMERWGTPSTMVGLSAALAGLGNLLTVPFVPRLARWIGVKTLIAIMLALSAGLHVAFWFVPGFFVWSAFRFVLGGSIGTLFVLSEYWIASGADPARRGIVMGAYSTALGMGFAIGPMLLSLTGTTGALPYVATAVVILTGAVPLLLIGREAPRVDGHAKAPVISFIRIAPAATFAALTVGALEIGAFTQLPIHGLRLGLLETDSAKLVSAFAIGNVLLQIPVGWLADRFDRRKVLLGIALSAIMLAASLLITGNGFWPNALVLMGLGGLVGALYTVGLAHLAHRFTDADLVSANAAFVMLYSVGQMAGPPLIGAGIDIAGGSGLPIVVVLVASAYAGLVLGRIGTR